MYYHILTIWFVTILQEEQINLKYFSSYNGSQLQVTGASLLTPHTTPFHSNNHATTDKYLSSPLENYRLSVLNGVKIVRAIAKKNYLPYSHTQMQGYQTKGVKILIHANWNISKRINWRVKHCLMIGDSGYVLSHFKILTLMRTTSASFS